MTNVQFLAKLTTVNAAERAREDYRSRARDARSRGLPYLATIYHRKARAADRLAARLSGVQS